MSTVAVVKKFINAPDDVVREALGGVAAAHPGSSGSTSRTSS